MDTMITGQNNRQVQSILYLTLLLSTLILTTGCFGKPNGGIIDTRSRMARIDDRFPNPNQLTRTQTPYIDFQPADDLDNNGWLIEDVVEDFIGAALVGRITNMTINFHNDTVIISVWDEDAAQYPFVVTLYLDHDLHGISYSDDEGTVYFEMTEDSTISQVSFENIDGTSGVLGYIDTCRVQGTC